MNIKYVLISPYKLRKVSVLLKNKSAIEALSILNVLPQKAANYFTKHLNQHV